MHRCKSESVSHSAMSDSAIPWTVCSLPGSSVHGILQSRILEWVAIPFTRGSSQPRDQTWVSHIASRFFTVWATREAQLWLGTFSFNLDLNIMKNWRIKGKKFLYKFHFILIPISHSYITNNFFGLPWLY